MWTTLIEIPGNMQQVRKAKLSTKILCRIKILITQTEFYVK